MVTVILEDSVALSPKDTTPKPSQTLALFGGTFDPVHLGHVQTIAALQDDLSIDQIRWILSAQPPHRDQPSASIEQRLAMLDLAIAEYPKMVSDDVEVRRKKASYTIDTLEHFRKLHPQESIVLIVGSDIMDSFHKWHRYDDILKVANIVVMHRAGYTDKPAQVLLPYVTNDWQKLRNNAYGRVMLYPAPSIPISATKVRNALSGLAENAETATKVSEWLDPKVLAYIQEHKLYSGLK